MKLGKIKIHACIKFNVGDWKSHHLVRLILYFQRVSKLRLEFGNNRANFDAVYRQEIRVGEWTYTIKKMNQYATKECVS